MTARNVSSPMVLAATNEVPSQEMHSNIKWSGTAILRACTLIDFVEALGQYSFPIHVHCCCYQANLSMDVLPCLHMLGALCLINLETNQYESKVKGMYSTCPK